MADQSIMQFFVTESSEINRSPGDAKQHTSPTTVAGINTGTAINTDIYIFTTVYVCSFIQCDSQEASQCLFFFYSDISTELNKSLHPLK
jgi:hypothetical protein